MFEVDAPSRDEPEWHPISKLAWFVAYPPAGANFEPKLERALEELANTSELRPAVLSLVSLAKHLEETGEVTGAERILAAARRMIPALEAGRDAAAALAQDQRRAHTATFRRFRGEEESVTAPRYGEPPTQGTFKVASVLGRGPRHL